MKQLIRSGLLVAALLGAPALADVPISGLPNGGLLQPSDYIPMVRGGVTMKANPYLYPASGSLLISNGTAAPSGILPVPGSCLVSVGSTWMAAPCMATSTVAYIGSPAANNLAFWSAAGILTNGDLTGDVTTSGGKATTLVTVNSNVGSFGSSTAIPNFTVDAKGRISAAGSNAIVAPAGTLTGTTLASGVVSSSLISTDTSNPLQSGGFTPRSTTCDALRFSMCLAGPNALEFANAQTEILEIDGGSSTADYLVLGAANTGDPVTIAAVGSDPNVPITISGQGTGVTDLQVNGINSVEAGANKATLYDHMANTIAGSSAPTCGTGCASVTAGSTDSKGSLTTGSSVSSITLNFGTTWGSAPTCVISSSSTAATSGINTISTSLLTIATSSAVTGTKFYWICFQ